MPTWLSCGKQRYHIDEEALFWELHGEVTATEIHGITDILVALHRQHGVALAVCDARASSAITPEARKAISDRHTAGTAVAAPSVIFGGSAIQRTLLPLVIRAIRLLGGKPPEIDFVATEQEAHAWLARKRKQAPR